MEIDGRDLDTNDVFLKLKELLTSNRACYLSVNVIVKTGSDANKIAGFASMSGCTAKIDKKESYYIIHITGIPCCT